MQRRTATALLPLLLLLAGCGDSAEASETRAKFREAFDALGSYTQKQLAELTVSLKDNVAGVEAEAKRLLGEAAARSDELKARLGELARDAEQKAQAARARLQAAADAGGDDARRALAEAQLALADAKTALEKAFAELRGK